MEERAIKDLVFQLRSLYCSTTAVNFLSKIACKKFPSPAEGSKNVADTFSQASVIPGVSSIF